MREGAGYLPVNSISHLLRPAENDLAESSQADPGRWKMVGYTKVESQEDLGTVLMTPASVNLLLYLFSLQIIFLFLSAHMMENDFLSLLATHMNPCL